MTTKKIKGRNNEWRQTKGGNMVRKDGKVTWTKSFSKKGRKTVTIKSTKETEIRYKKKKKK